MVETSKYVNLHQHSEYSPLDGLAKVGDIASRAKELGQDFACITDHADVSAHLAFQKACDKQGIGSVLGLEGYWLHDISAARADKDPKTKRAKYPHPSHMCLLALNDTGLRNIWNMSSLGYSEKNFFYKPTLEPADMKEHSEGVLASDGCLMSGLGQAVELGDEDMARRHIGTLLDIFGDRFYMELHTWQYYEAKTAEQRRLNNLMTELNQVKLLMATELGVPLVIVNDAHHARPEDWENKELVWQLNTKGNADQQAYGQKADHLMGEDELYYWMSRHGIGPDVVSEAIKNSHIIAEACTARIKPTLSLPVFSGDGDDIGAFLREIEKGFKRRVIDAGLDAEVYYARVEREARVIIDKGFPSYFLVVQDYVNAARDGSWANWVGGHPGPVPMITGPGRGSAAGCLISYLLGITTVDPIKYGLLFERFMNPDRQVPPDIDVDFPQSMRPGIKSYIGERWGHDHVCTLGTLTRNGPRGMLRDLARGYRAWSGQDADISYAEVDKMTKIVDRAIAVVAEEREAQGDVDGTDDDLSWDAVLTERGGELAPWVKKYPALFDKVGELTGIIRQSGVHASGVLINGDPLGGRVPTKTTSKDKTLVVQLEMGDIEAIGGIKFDILGIRHLDTVDHARKLIAERHGVQLDFAEFGDNEMRDPAIWDQIDSGHTVGVFQVEPALGTQTAMEMKPRSEVDLAALISIIRPGVRDAGLTDEFLRRRSGSSPVVYDHPLLKSITDETYGVLCYQEQLIFASIDLAGFTAAEGDDLRRALGKKKADDIEAMSGRFRDGCLNNAAFMDPIGGDAGAAGKIVDKVWASINASGKYLFNKSHAVGYAVVAAWEVWLKHYYPEEFITALLATDDKQTTRYVREARRRGIKVLPPDINDSAGTFSIDPQNNIRYGLDSMRGVAEKSAAVILRGRPYASFADYLDRGNTNKTVLNNLISIGAFDALEYDPDRDGEWVPGCRSRLMQEAHDFRVWSKVAEGKRAKMDAQQRAEHLEAWYAKHSADKGFAQEYGVPDFSDPNVVYQIENDLVGTFILVDPMGPYLSILADTVISDPIQIESVENAMPVDVGGQVVKIKTHMTNPKRGESQQMAFVGLEYNGCEFSVTFFPGYWAEVKSLVKVGVPVVIRCIRDERGVHAQQVHRLDLLQQQEVS